MSRNGKNPRLDLRPSMSGHRGSSSGVAGGSSSNNNSRNRNRNNDNNRGHNNNNNNRGQLNNSAQRRSPSSSPPSSCVSSEAEQEEDPSSMVLVGCPHCLMYVMLSSEDPRCPKCKSSVLLDFLNDPKNTGGAAASTRKSKKN